MVRKAPIVPVNPEIYVEEVEDGEAREHLARYLSDPTDTRSLDDFSRDTKITPLQIRSFQTDSSFQKLVMQSTVRNLQGVFPQLLKSSMARAMKGSSRDFDQLMKLATGDTGGPSINIFTGKATDADKEIDDDFSKMTNEELDEECVKMLMKTHPDDVVWKGGKVQRRTDDTFGGLNDGDDQPWRTVGPRSRYLLGSGGPKAAEVEILPAIEGEAEEDVPE